MRTHLFKHSHSSIPALLIFLFLCSHALHAQFVRNKPYPDSLVHTDSYIYNDSIYWSVCDDGTIFKTTDGGATRIRQSIGNKTYLADIYFLDSLTGFVCGQNNSIYRTADGGSSWVLVHSITSVEINRRIYFYNNQIGFVLNSAGRIFKTSDGGFTWFELTPFVETQFNNIIFRNETDGIVLGEQGELYRTTNGGLSWQLYPTGIITDFYEMRMLSQNELIASGTGNIIARSTDFGVTWAPAYTGVNESFKHIYFTDSLRGYGLGFNYKLYITTDKGYTWSQVPGMPAGYLPQNLTGSKSGKAYISCRANKLLVYSPESSWNAILTRIAEHIFSISAFDRYKMICAAENGTILYSNTNGSSWAFPASGTLNNLYSIHFAQDNIGWIAGAGGTILKSTSGGTSWNASASGVNTSLHGIYGFTGTTAIAVGDSGTILRTTNGGQNWHAIPSGTTHKLNAVDFNSALIGTIAGNHGTLLRTTDGGTTWFPQESTVTANLNCITLTNPTGSAVGGDSGVVLFSSNAGDTWNAGVISSMKSITSTVKYNGNSVLLLTGTGNVLIMSPLNFVTSTYYNNTSQYHLNDIYLPDLLSSSLVGNSGIVLRSWQSTEPPIPVELLSFSAKITDSKVDLTWNTATETNNRGFEVQKSINNKEWFDIGFVSGSGTATDPAVYTFTDNYPSRGIMYYRLRQIDYDGRAEILRQIEVPFESSYELEQNYPNPFNPETEISYSIPYAGKVSIIVYDALGREVQLLVNKLQEPGRYTVSFNGSSLASGIYYYKITAGKYFETKKMILLK